LELTFSQTSSFFDRAAVIQAVGKARASALNRAGGMLRLTMRRSIRARKKVSQPGAPPSSHAPEPNLRTILYAFDGRSVFVGPVKLNGGRRRTDGITLKTTVPNALEQGAPLQIAELELRTGWIRATDRALSKFPSARRRVVSATIAPRPFAAPALVKVAPKLPSLINVRA
jgi:hypothetical protein